MLYLDSSALVKRYIREAGTDDVRNAIQSDPYAATSILSGVEVRAALAAARAGRIADLRTLVALFERDWSNFLAIGVDAQLVGLAGDLAERHALRGSDAVQLAAALAARTASRAIRFGTFDHALRRAAAAEELSLLPF